MRAALTPCLAAVILLAQQIGKYDAQMVFYKPYTLPKRTKLLPVPTGLVPEKRISSSAKPKPRTACKSRTDYNFYPQTAISNNFTVVEVKPPDVEPVTHQQFVVTECANEHESCAGSSKNFETYCETWPHWHLTYIRKQGSDDEYRLGQILLPSGCRCLVQERTEADNHDRLHWNLIKKSYGRSMGLEGL